MKKKSKGKSRKIGIIGAVGHTGLESAESMVRDFHRKLTKGDEIIDKEKEESKAVEYFKKISKPNSIFEIIPPQVQLTIMRLIQIYLSENKIVSPTNLAEELIEERNRLRQMDVAENEDCASFIDMETALKRAAEVWKNWEEAEAAGAEAAEKDMADEIEKVDMDVELNKELVGLRDDLKRILKKYKGLVTSERVAIITNLSAADTAIRAMEVFMYEVDSVDYMDLSKKNSKKLKRDVKKIQKECSVMLGWVHNQLEYFKDIEI